MALLFFVILHISSSDIDEPKKTGRSSLIIAIIGVIVNLLGGLGFAYLFNKTGIMESDASVSLLFQNMFINVISTATLVALPLKL